MSGAGNSDAVAIAIAISVISDRLDGYRPGIDEDLDGLGFSSLDLVATVVELERAFGVQYPELDFAAWTVREIVAELPEAGRRE